MLFLMLGASCDVADMDDERGGGGDGRALSVADMTRERERQRY
jgi:hypothetical protein